MESPDGCHLTSLSYSRNERSSATDQCVGKVVETSSDWFQTIVLAENPFLPVWAIFILSQLQNGHERVVKWKRHCMVC